MYNLLEVVKDHKYKVFGDKSCKLATVLYSTVRSRLPNYNNNHNINTYFRRREGLYSYTVNVFHSIKINVYSFLNCINKDGRL